MKDNSATSAAAATDAVDRAPASFRTAVGSMAVGVVATTLAHILGQMRQMLHLVQGQL